MLAALVSSNNIILHGDTHDDVDRFVKWYRKRKKRRLEEVEESREEIVTEAYNALQDVPEVRQELRTVMHTDHTPALAEILTSYQAMAELLRRYEAMLQDEDDIEALLMLGDL